MSTLNSNHWLDVPIFLKKISDESNDVTVEVNRARTLAKMQILEDINFMEQIESQESIWEGI